MHHTRALTTIVVARMILIVLLPHPIPDPMIIHSPMHASCRKHPDAITEDARRLGMLLPHGRGLLAELWWL
jgi:hypothetical protein